MAAFYRGPQHSTIRLSQSVPTHAFAHRWGQPAAMRCLSREQRNQLLRLTAASGSIENFQLLRPIVGLLPSDHVALAAAAAGQGAMLRWLHDQRWPMCPLVPNAAGSFGSWELCAWSIEAGGPHAAGDAAVGAAKAGHAGLVDRLLASYFPAQEYPGWLRSALLAAVAEACDLPTLRRLHPALRKGAGRRLTSSCIDAAAGSALPDWRDKLEWLVAQGYPRSASTSVRAARCTDAADRLRWLTEHGWPLDAMGVALAAAEHGRVDILELVLGVQGRQGESDLRAEAEEAVVVAAASKGHLAVLQYLHARGWSVTRACSCAAKEGHLTVVAWLMEVLGADAVLNYDVFTAVVYSGSLPLMRWLQQRGYEFRDTSALHWALEGGASEEVLEWLLAQGCSQLRHDHWPVAGQRGDLGALAWLRRMGCPWAANGDTFVSAIFKRCSLPVLRWLLEAGCPVDWAAVRRAVEQLQYREEEDFEAVGYSDDELSWFEEHFDTT